MEINVINTFTEGSASILIGLLLETFWFCAIFYEIEKRRGVDEIRSIYSQFCPYPLF
jgi:hypothetical protein